LISSYLCHLPVRSSSSEVIFHGDCLPDFQKARVILKIPVLGADS
jgi:hypothetical protein